LLVLGSGAVRLLHCDLVVEQDFLKADGYIFVCPENLGSMAGAMKECFDRLYYPLLDQLPGRPYLGMISAGSDGQGAARQMDRICTGWRLRKIDETFIACSDAQTTKQILAPKKLRPEQKARAMELAQTLTEGLALGIF
jgi:multimeric flavodoxin WrbA